MQEDIFDSLDHLNLPEPEYEIETFDEEGSDDDCAGGACKI